jgi:hypothetical protein
MGTKASTALGNLTGRGAGSKAALHQQGVAAGVHTVPAAKRIKSEDAQHTAAGDCILIAVAGCQDVLYHKQEFSVSIDTASYLLADVLQYYGSSVEEWDVFVHNRTPKWAQFARL